MTRALRILPLVVLVACKAEQRKCCTFPFVCGSCKPLDVCKDSFWCKGCDCGCCNPGNPAPIPTPGDGDAHTQTHIIAYTMASLGVDITNSFEDTKPWGKKKDLETVGHPSSANVFPGCARSSTSNCRWSSDGRHLLLVRQSWWGTDIGPDRVAFYSSGPWCALVFEGSQAPQFSVATFDDWLNNLDVWTVKQVGEPGHESGGLLDFRFQSGFVRELQEFNLTTDLLKGWIKGGCTSGLFMAGHSLGGSVGSIYAAIYANLAQVRDASLPRFAGLYTFGALPITKPGPAFPEFEDAQCFLGARYFNLDSLSGDPAPGVFVNLFGFVHPKVLSFRLKDPAFGGDKIEATPYNCFRNFNEGEKEPKTGPIPPLPDFGVHTLQEYRDRLGKVIADS